MMYGAVEARFGCIRTPHSVEILTDNSSAYTAKQTCIFARQLGLRPCFTPLRNSQCNGISEAFVHTLKRDYVQGHPALPDAASALALIGIWFDDCNDHHMHSGLRMRSPREFCTAQTATA